MSPAAQRFVPPRLTSPLPPSTASRTDDRFAFVDRASLGLSGCRSPNAGLTTHHDPQTDNSVLALGGRLDRDPHSPGPGPPGPLGGERALVRAVDLGERSASWSWRAGPDPVGAHGHLRCPGRVRDPVDSRCRHPRFRPRSRCPAHRGPDQDPSRATTPARPVWTPTKGWLRLGPGSRPEWNAPRCWSGRLGDRSPLVIRR